MAAMAAMAAMADLLTLGRNAVDLIVNFAAGNSSALWPRIPKSHSSRLPPVHFHINFRILFQVGFQVDLRVQHES